MSASSADTGAGSSVGETPARCSTCSTELTPGATRCPGCGKVFGEANRCHRCNAIAAVTPSGKGYVCLACGAPRQLAPGTTVISNGSLGVPQSQPPAADSFARVARAPAVRSSSFSGPSRFKTVSLRAGGVVLLAAGVLGAALSVVITGGATAGFLVAAAVGGAGAGLGGLMLRAGGRASTQADRRHSLAVEQAILDLAAERAGVLRVTDVARGLGVTVAEADEFLSGLADGSRVTVEITPDGLLVYHFREVESAPPRMRVDVAALDEQQVEEPEPASAGANRGRESDS
ncbi:MAG: hypothetical protein GXP55_17840 [Deltaproteobacteria bacterium]|nr:hypothetical protein [Deltaproteobacteria bacterium]